MNRSTVGNPNSGAWIEKWLSEPRLETYLRRCHGNRDEAMRLYEWNTDLGLVLLKDIGYFEVALRNAYDRVIANQGDETLFVSWTFSAAENEGYTFDGISRVHFDPDGRIDHVKEYRADHDQYRPLESEG